MAFTFFTDFERNIDQMVVQIVTTISSNSMDYFLPVVTSGLGISFLWFGAMCVLGNYDAPAMDFLKRILVVAIVVGVAGAGGLYQTEIMNLILGLPSELSSALVGGGNGDVNVLDIASEKTLDKTMQIFDLVGVSPSSWLNALVGVVFFVSGLFLIGSTAVFFIISKVVVGILAGLGFIFIFAFLWEPLRNFFSAWVNQIVHYSLMLVISSLFFSFLMGMYDRFISAFTIGESNLLYTAFAIAAFTYIGYRLLGEIPTLCAALSQSVHIGELTKSSSKAQQNNAPASSKGDSPSHSSPKDVSASPVPSPVSDAPFRGKSAS
ncbi:type IV secretion system protein [Cronobacter sakazakii]|nr:type IV secretion system protein [Cronobacter sakazakii]